MVINLALLVLISASVIRTTAYGIYCIKNSGIAGGISVFFLGALSFFTGVVIFITRIA